ncbi:MAG: hypothetical protein WCF82_07400 [Microcoleus sp.]
MANKVRNTSGKFAPKSEVPRKVRSVNLTDTAWQWLADVAAKSGVSRNDYLEALADGATPLMETVSSDKIETTQQPESDVSPLMETVNHALTTPEEALAHAAIFGFTPEEALADAHFQVNMLTSNYDELEDKYESAKRELAELRSQLEAERGDREEVERELIQANQKLKDAQATIQAQRGKIHNLERGYGFEETPTEKILRRQIRDLEHQLSDLKQNLVTASQDLPEAASLLNQLKAKRKKSSVTLADVEFLLELLEG